MVVYLSYYDHLCRYRANLNPLLLPKFYGYEELNIGLEKLIMKWAKMEYNILTKGI